MKNVKPGHSKPIICLDAGHYGKYNRSPVVPEYYESDMNWKLHLKLKAELEKYGIKVITTRAEQAKDMGLEARGKASEDCDLFLSIHSNAADSESVDYPVAYVMLDGKGDVLGTNLALAIQLTMGTAQKGKISSRKGSRGEYYGVLRGAAAVGTVGMILEHSFHTNTKATKWLLVDANLDKMSKVEAKLIAEYFDVTKTAEEPEQLYRIRKTWADAKSQTAAYKNLDNAKKNCPAGYSVFDWNGKAVYTNAPKPTTYTLTLPVLKKGDKGSKVEALQHLLMANKIKLPKYGADGDFGGETETGVIAFQKAVGIDDDGVVGHDTMSKLLGV